MLTLRMASYVKPVKGSHSQVLWPVTQADVYAFAVILWELCTGLQPFSGYNAAQLVVAKCHSPTRELLRFLEPGVPDVLQQLCWDCWRRDAARRCAAWPQHK